MTLKQLETFYWICRVGSFIAAAQHLNTTQSAVSMRIRDLEESLGVQLFNREPRTARPTAKGRELLFLVEQLLHLTGRIRQSVGDPRMLTGKIRLGVTELVAVTWLADLVALINREFPAITVELDVDLTYNQVRKLETGGLNIGLIPGPIEVPGFAQVSLGSVRMRWVASPVFEIPDEIHATDSLHRWPLLILTRNSNLHSKVISSLGHAAHPSRINVCNNIGTLAAMAIAGIGLAYLPIDYYADEIESGKLRIIRTEPQLPDLEYFAVYDRRSLEPILETIAEFARSTSRFNPEPQGGPAA